jgi:hypothetical protein
MEFEERLYQKQAELITKLRDENRQLEQKLLDQKIGSKFYLALVEAVKDDVMLEGEWRRFIAILRLAKPNLPGLTVAEKDFYS